MAELKLLPNKSAALHTAEVQLFELVRKSDLARANLLLEEGARNGTEQVGSLVEELLAHQEELQIIEEELRAQLDELSRSRAELEHERRRYTDLFEMLSDPVFVTDRMGMICESNRASSELLGRDASEIHGLPLAGFVAVDDRFELRSAVNRACAAEMVTVTVLFGGRNGPGQRVVLRGRLMSDMDRILFIGCDVADGPD